VRSNIVIFDLKDPFTAENFLAALKAKGVLALPFGPQTVRLITHLDVSEEMVEYTIEVLQSL
jgi:threonine aldolase